MRKERKHYTAEEKVAVLRRHLLDKVPVSDLCERNAGVQCSIEFNPYPRHWHTSDDDIIYEEADVSAAYIASMKSFEIVEYVSWGPPEPPGPITCTCLAGKDDAEYPNLHTLELPGFQDESTAGARPRPARGSRILQPMHFAGE
jgi:hypothetical protein